MRYYSKKGNNMDIVNVLRINEKYNEFLAIVTDFVGQQEWLAIFLVLLSVLICERVVLFLFKHILKLTHKTTTDLDDKVIRKSSRPIGNFILLFGVYVIIQIFKLPKSPVDIKTVLLVATKIAVVLNTIWLFLEV